MWLMLEGFTDKADLLIRNGIAATPVSIQRPASATGIAFPSDRRNDVLRLLGVDHLMWDEQDTDQSGVKILIQKNFGDEATVYMQSYEQSARYRKILVEWAEKLRIGIKGFIPHGEPHAPEGKDGTLHVYIWSTPFAASKSPIGRAFGISLREGTQDGLRPSGRGTIITDDSGVQIAEVLPWNVYILFDITHHDGYQELLNQVLERAIPAALPEEWSEQIKAIKEREIARKKLEESERRERFLAQREQNRALYIQACTGRIGDVLKSKKQTLQKGEKDLETLSQQLVNLTREMEIVRAELSGLETGTSEFGEKFGKEFDQLYENPMIARVDISSTKIDVYTKDIRIQYRGRWWNFGEFLIRIHLRGELQLFSTRNRVEVSHVVVHPHVKQGGIGCLGNILNEVNKLIARQEYVILINLLIDFLHSYSPDNHVFQTIENWPSE